MADQPVRTPEGPHIPPAQEVKQARTVFTPASIAVALVTYNDAAILRDCLESVAWADEIIVTDLGSTDETCTLAERYGAIVATHAWVPYADPIRDEVIARARAPWVLMLDPDERVTPTLARRLRTLAGTGEIDVALIPLWLMAFGHRREDGRAVQDRQPRFFRKGVLSWPAEVHGRPSLDGLCVQTLEPEADGYLLHDSWRSIDEIMDKFARYSREEAALLDRRGVQFTPALLLSQTAHEVGRALAYETERSGIPGLVGLLLGLSYRWFVLARLWERQGFVRTHDQAVERWLRPLGAVPRRLLPLYTYLRTRGEAGR